MKKVILACLMTMLTICGAVAQNYPPPEPHRDTNQNCVLKLDYITYIDGNYVVNVTNKQDCDVRVLFLYQHSEFQAIVPPNSTTAVALPTTTQQTDVVIWAQATNRCNPAGCFDNFWVQTTPSGAVGGPLGITFKGIRTSKIDANTIKLTFDVENATGKGYYNVRVSKDLKTWRTVTVIFPSDAKANETYSVIIKL